jgi:tripartite-type tricarboxylate transporter receptor subunit TctC
MQKDAGKYNYSSIGVGSMSHLSVEIVKLKSNSYAVHLPYASSPLAVLAIMQGDVQFACLPPVAVMPQAKAGKLKAIAVTSAKRSQLVPELPTMAESGFPDIQALAWMAIMAPAGTPKDIITRVTKDIVAILNEPETQQKLAVAYMESVGSTPEELAKWMIEERDRWAPVIKHVGLTAN